MASEYDLVCFDMDGVLTRLRSSWKWIHESLGVDNEAAYRAFINQEIDEKEFMRRDIGKWKEAKPDINERDLVRWFRDMPVISGIQETVAALHEAGAKCVIISGGIDIAAKMLMNENGFDGCIADRILTDEMGYLTGEGEAVVDLSDKGVFVRRYIDAYHTSKERTVSVGNSFTDIPMFKSSAMSIAFNPTDPYTSDAATYTVKSDNISDVLEYILPDDPYMKKCH